MKKVVILGASSDMGRATIEELVKSNAEEQFTIYAHYLTTEEKLLSLADTYENLSVIPVQADLSKEEEVLCLIDKLQKIFMDDAPDYFLHFPAFPFDYMRMKELNVEKIRKELEISVYSFLHFAKAFFHKMQKKEDARVVVMLTSFITEALPPKFMTDYIVTKYALLGAMKAAAAEYGGKKLCINAISPAMTETSFLELLDEKIIEMNRMQAKDGKLLSPADIAPMVVAMLSSTYEKNGDNQVIS